MNMRTKPHRLPETEYRGHKTVSFTACIENRKRPFTDPTVVSEFVQILAQATQKQQCAVPAYCFMPDHLHLLILGQTPESRIKLAMDDFKRTSSAWFRAKMPSLNWQKSYHDHIIRNGEDLGQHVRYLLENPVRAGLVEDWNDYPFSGSIGIELSEYLLDLDEDRKSALRRRF